MKTKLINNLLVFFIVGICASCGVKKDITYHYETYAPLKETLDFNDSVCVYSCVDLFNPNDTTFDTCYYKMKKKHIILYARENSDENNTSSTQLEDTFQMRKLDFVYDIFPKIYGMSRGYLMHYSNFLYPLACEECYSFYRPWKFYERYRNGFQFTTDTIFVLDKKYIFLKKESIMHSSNLLRDSGKKLSKDISQFIKIRKNYQGKWNSHYNRIYSCYNQLLNTYEYVNYGINAQKVFTFDQDELLHNTFTYIVDSCKIEEIEFVDSTTCLHSISYRLDSLSPYIPIKIDTCSYSIKGNHITIAAQNSTNYGSMKSDVLVYSEGILFYSKVYDIPDRRGYARTMIVKPFILEGLDWESLSSKRDAILNAYFNVYVPINY